MKRLLIIACACVALISCGDREELTDPPVVSVSTLFDSSKLTDGDTIYFHGNTGSLDYDIAISEDQELVGCVFTYDGETATFTELSGNFHISAGTDPDKKLTCEVHIRSDNKSFLFKYQWPVSFFLQPEPSLSASINQDGFLELSWNRLQVSEKDFNRYVVYVHADAPIAEITDINRTSCVIPSYSGARCSFTVKAVYMGDKSWILGSVTQSGNVYLSCDYSDEVLISWTNDCKATATVTIDNVVVAETKEQSVRIPYATFGSGAKEVKLAFSPYSANGPVYPWSTFEVTQNAYLGGYKFTYNLISITDHAYNPAEDVLYLNCQERIGAHLSARAFPDLSSSNSIRSDPWTYLASSYKNSTILVDRHSYAGERLIYDGKAFNVVNTLPLPGIHSPVKFALTNDSRLIYIDESDTIKVYNIEGTVLLHKIKIPEAVPHDINNSLVHISPDATHIYFSDRGNSRVAVLNMNGYAISKTQELAGAFSGGWCVNPLKAEQLFVSDGNTIKEYNGNDLSLVHTWNYADMKIGNVDPKSNCLLAYNNDFAVVIDTETKETVHSRPVTGGRLFHLYSYTLISLSDCQLLSLLPFIGQNGN